MSLKLVHLKPIDRINNQILRFLGLNPGTFTLQGSNTYLVGTGRRRVLIDTGDGVHSKYFENLASVLHQEQCIISKIVLTHSHSDHIGGVSHILSNPVQFSGGEKVTVYKHQSAIRDEHVRKLFQFDLLHDRQIIEADDGIELEIIYSPGHTDDHVFVNIAKQGILFCADTVLGQGSTIFMDLKNYMKSLYMLKEMDIYMLLPGHGPSIVGHDAVQAKLTEYIKHREERGNMIFDAISRKKNQGTTLVHLVEQMYPNPEHHLVGSHIVNQYLCKFLDDNLIVLSKQNNTDVYTIR